MMTCDGLIKELQVLQADRDDVRAQPDHHSGPLARGDSGPNREFSEVHGPPHPEDGQRILSQMWIEIFNRKK